MADEMRIASYRVVSITFRGTTPDVNALVKSARTAILYAEGIAAMQASFRPVALMSATAEPDIKAAVRSARTAILYTEKITLLQAAFRPVSLQTITTNPDLNGLVKAARTAILMAPALGLVKAARVAFIIDQKEVGSPTYVGQTYDLVTQASPQRPVDQVISREFVKQAYQMGVSAADPMPFLWSYTRSAQMRELVLQARPNVVQSYDMSKQVRMAVVGRFNYTIPGDIWSSSRASQQVMLVLQSLDIPYTPTSGEFVRQQFLVVLQASAPLPIWTSPAYIRQTFALVAQKRPVERLPRSYVQSAHVTTQAVTKRPAEPLPYSRSRVAEMVTQAVQATDMPEPVGRIESAQVFNLAVVPSTMPVRVGTIEDRQVLTQVTTSRIEPPPISRERVPQVRTLAAGAADYTDPGMMLNIQGAQVRVEVVQHAAYPPPDFQSYEIVPQVQVIFSTKPPASVYPDPAEVYERSKVAMMPQMTELVTQRHLLPLPLSVSEAVQVGIAAVQKAIYPTPEEMANTGIFSWTVAEQLALVADYPSTAVPTSNVVVTQAAEQIAIVADYPDAHLPTNYAIIPQLAEQVAIEDFYPDPGTYRSPNAAWQIAEQLTYESDFPDAGTLHSPVLALQLAQTVSLAASFPDKDVPQSIVRVAQLSQQAAFRATYPNKDVPQSIVRVNQVRQTVVRRDLTMYQLPAPPRRHRVRITCRFVY